MKKQYVVSKNLKIAIFACLVLGMAGTVTAINPFIEIEYPVEELGNCQDREECKQFCDNPDNMEPCLIFAKEMGLISEQEAQRAERMMGMENEVGPGGCVGKDRCEAYCDQIENIRECIKFAEENNLIPPEELEEAKKVIRAMDQGFNPPNCNSKRECDIYCGQVEHMEECIEFGIAAGMMPEQEQAEAKKMLKALKAGIRPPNCNGKKECDVYCNEPEHMEECIEFGIAAGLMPLEEQEGAKKMLKALKAGIKPPNCRGDRECDEYCRKPKNMAECMEFSILAGFAPPEEVEMMKKTVEAIKSGVMPPNCSNDEECRTYCQQEEHMEECINFSVAIGDMTPEEAEKAKKAGGKGPGGCVGEQECEAFCSNPNNARECIQFGVMMGDISQEEADKMIADMDRGKMGGEMMIGGPGGCQTPEECADFCSKPENKEECSNFGEAVFQTGEIQPMTGPVMMSPEEQERLKQELKEEYGDDWQQVYDEKVRERMGEMPSGQWIGPDGGYQNIQQEQIKQEYMQKYGDEWEGRFDEYIKNQYQEGLLPEPRMGPYEGEQQKMPVSDGEQFQFTPGGVNERIFNAEQKLREGIIREGEEMPPKDTWIYQEGMQEPFYREPSQEPKYDVWQEGASGQWVDEQSGQEIRIENKVWEGEAEYRQEPIELQPKNVMPQSTYTEPVPMSQPAPQPSNTGSMSPQEPAPMIEPAPMQGPATEAPQSLFEPFKKFLGSAVEFLLSH